MNKLIMDGRSIDIATAIEKYKSLNKSANLKERYKAIFEYKLGINNGKIKTYAETGLQFGISSTRVRQICACVLFKKGVL